MRSVNVAMRTAVPLVLFIVVMVFLAVGLQRDPRLVPSPLLGKAVPAFSLPNLAIPAHSVVPADLDGQVYLLNVWASWCVACRSEHPLLVEMAAQKRLVLIGLNYKDQRQDALAWLTRHGDPYTLSLFDQEGRLGLDLGVYGVPETFVIDKKGVIRYKHVGPLNQAALRQDILPLVDKLASESS
jgi:cytochrome c biogenesis protein CcmG/thiol:disulfide interchange protein DsbE